MKLGAVAPLVGKMVTSPSMLGGTGEGGADEVKATGGGEIEQLQHR